MYYVMLSDVPVVQSYPPLCLLPPEAFDKTSSIEVTTVLKSRGVNCTTRHCGKRYNIALSVYFYELSNLLYMYQCFFYF